MDSNSGDERAGVMAAAAVLARRCAARRWVRVAVSLPPLLRAAARLPPLPAPSFRELMLPATVEVVGGGESGRPRRYCAKC